MKYDDEKKDNRTPSRVAGMSGQTKRRQNESPSAPGRGKNSCYLM
jgi:hypothetical protein